jgi:hypothetical protein
MQDRKYAPGSTGSQNPDLQRWKLAPYSGDVPNPTAYTVSCAAIPSKVLLPVNAGKASAIAVVLADPLSQSPFFDPNLWNVTSPLLPSTVGRA